MHISRRLSKKQQLHLLSDLHRLAKAGIKQKDVAQQLILFGSPRYKLIGENINTSLTNGGTFAEGLKPWIATLAWEALIANEVTGNWAQGLAHAKQAVSIQSAATTQLIKALFLPFLGLMLLFGLAGANATYFLPLLGVIVPKAQWGDWTNLSFNFGVFSNEWGIYIAMTLIVLLITAIISLPFLTGRWRKMLDNWPLFRQYRLIQVSSLLRSMSYLSQAGFGLQDSLNHLKQATSPYLKYHINQMLGQIKEGKNNLGKVMNTGILNRAEQHSMLILGELGETVDTLHSCAEIHQELLISEINLIKDYGGDILKISAAMIGGIIAGGIGGIILQLPSMLKF